MEARVKNLKFPNIMGMAYTEACDHKLKCNYQKRYCDFDCGKKIMGHQMEAHKT